MKFAATLLLLLLFTSVSFAAVGADSKVRKEWNFTPQDYARLRASGGELRFSERSSWMPEALRASILSVLNQTLNPKLTPSSTAGINRLDFFHGHFVCTGHDVRIRDLGSSFNERSVAVFKKAGFTQTEELTKATYPAFAAAVDEVDQMSSVLLRDLLPLCENTRVMFHSFEYNNEKYGVGVNDARRHIYVALGGGPIERIEDHPVDALDQLFKMKVNLWDDTAPAPEYSHMSHFGFLIDRSGVIHLTQGSGFSLHRFTGYRD